jgi:polar amino acid transport system substrate-binding protein
MTFTSSVKKFTAVGALTAASVLVLASCGGDSAAPAGDGGSTRTLTIATSNDAPFSFEEGGVLTGIDGDMLAAIAKEKGWQVKPFTTEFSTLIPALKAGKADVIVDAMYITDARKKEVDFTDPWYSQGEGMIVPSDSTVTSRDQLAGKVLGAQTGTAFADFIATLGGSETKLFDSQATLIQAVANGQVDAAFTDSAVVSYSLKKNPNPAVKIVSPYEPHFPGTIGAAVSKDDTELLDELNDGLADLQATPQYLEILQKYGLTEANAVTAGS